jgi:predicted TIM-barrel fold metal-dependent hydrolase
MGADSRGVVGVIPKLISVDDHVVELPSIFQDRLPSKFKDRIRVERQKGTLDFVPSNSATPGMKLVPGGDNDRWADVWIYDDLVWVLTAGWGSIGPLRELTARTPVTYDEMLPGCYSQPERLEDMDANHSEAALCFPSFSRFCGQTYSERADKDFALLCLKAYNDWMIDEWCAGAGAGRLIPLTLIPLWDPQLAAAEVRRCAEKGSGAVAFSESPTGLGLPSIHSGHWDPFFEACDETRTVINMHIGSASKVATTSDDASLLVGMALTAQGSEGALCDWLTSGLLARYPNLKIALSEGQVGWMPYILERLDRAWENAQLYDPDIYQRVPNLPSSYLQGRVFGCVFDDVTGLQNRSRIGMDQIMFEIDYPHADSTYPASRQTAEKLIAEAGLNDRETWQLVRGNAIECFDLARFGIVE